MHRHRLPRLPATSCAPATCSCSTRRASLPRGSIGERRSSRRCGELLLLHPARARATTPGALRWIALARPARRLRRATEVALRRARRRGHQCRARRRNARDRLRARACRFEEFLERAGRLPLPPYIHNEPREAQERYQTVFARVPGSVAAPTASLHFTPQVLDAIAGARRRDRPSYARRRPGNVPPDVGRADRRSPPCTTESYAIPEASADARSKRTPNEGAAS